MALNEIISSTGKSMAKHPGKWLAGAIIVGGSLLLTKCNGPEETEAFTTYGNGYDLEQTYSRDTAITELTLAQPNGEQVYTAFVLEPTRGKDPIAKLIVDNGGVKEIFEDRNRDGQIKKGEDNYKREINRADGKYQVMGFNKNDTYQNLDGIDFSNTNEFKPDYAKINTDYKSHKNKFTETIEQKVLN